MLLNMTCYLRGQRRQSYEKLTSECDILGMIYTHQLSRRTRGEKTLPQDRYVCIYQDPKWPIVGPPHGSNRATRSHDACIGLMKILHA